MQKNKKKRKYTFRRWFAHWCAFQMVALNDNIWKPRFLLHDLDKPFLNLILSNELTAKLHRKYNDHHHKKGTILDIDGAYVDWKCSALTKKNAQRDARATLEELMKKKLTKETYKLMSNRIFELEGK